MTIIRAIGLGLALLSFSALAKVPDKEGVTLTEPQAIALFYQRNLALIAAKYNVDQARAEEIIASAIPNPVFSLTFSELNSRMFNDPQSDYLPALTPQIQQLIETAGKRQLRMEGSALATEAVEYDLQDTARTLTNAVRHAFYGLLLAQKNLDVAKDNLERYRQIMGANDIRLGVGDIAETDFTRIEVESLKAQGDLDKAQTALNQARADLLVLLGWPENSLTITATDEWPAANLAEEVTREDHLTRKALEGRPDLKAARIRIRQAEKSLELARRLTIPDVTVTGSYARDPGNYYTNTGAIGISVPLPIFYRQEGEIAKAGVAMSNAELSLRQAEQSVRADMIKALSAWKSADAIARRFEQSVVGRIEKMRSAQEFAYQKGAAGLLDLIDAERNYKAMMLDYYTALANRSNAWADLLMALGEEAK
ncbi:MAG: TolC family protein [Methylococcaceae bacterium]|nr:TolC family protein [Methylococcaceae bacterium]